MTTATGVKAKNVMGVNIAKIDVAVLAQSFKAVFKKDPPKAATEVVRELALHFQKEGERLMECEDCNGASSAEFGSCPYCGAADGDSAKVFPEEKENGSSVLAPTGIDGVEKSAQVVTETDLDASVVRIRQIRTEGSVALYRLGVEILNVYENDLWKLRNDEKGKPKYKTFTQFLAAEVDVHLRTAFRMMEVAKQFSADQADKYGNTLLRGLLAAPKEDREELLGKVDAGEIKGARGLEAEVREIRKRKGVDVVAGAGKNDTYRAKSTAKASAAAAKKKAAAKKRIVTLALPAGRKTVKLQARPLKKSDPTKPAKTLGDHPWGKLECQNGPVLYFALVKSAKGELELTVEARREE